MVQRELRKIEDAFGRVTPTRVVEAASDARHPLHSKFDWDDKVAGHKWRLEQARSLISSVKVTVEAGENKRVIVPKYHRDPQTLPENQGYRTLSSIAKDPDDARAVVVAEFVAAAAHLKRARNIAKAFNASDQIDDLISRLDILRVQIVNEAGNA